MYNFNDRIILKYLVQYIGILPDNTEFYAVESLQELFMIRAQNQISCFDTLSIIPYYIHYLSVFNRIYYYAEKI